MDLGLRGRACVVCGGSRGIGLEVARRLHAEGADLLLLGRGDAALRGAAAELGDGARVELLALDITESGAGEEVVEACQERFGRLDVLVNSAGASSVRAIDELTDEDWQLQWDINVMAPMRLMRAAVPVMVQAGWGRVVNISSSSGKRPGQRNVAYSVAKAAELSLSRAYADAYAQHGVLVNAVTPGPVASELWLAPGGSSIRRCRLVEAPVRRCSRRPPPGCRVGGWPVRRRSPP
jgi:3-oxoacyl-[acyl-carrier protein] reductase